MYYSSTTPYYKHTALYYKVLLRQKRRQNDVHPVLLRTTKYYSSTASYYKVLLRTTKYYSSTTPYYKVLFCTTKYYFDRNDVRTTSIQYYSVLQSTTPVLQSTTPALLRTTKYYKRTTKYYAVLQSTTPVLLRTTNVLLQYYSVLQSTTPLLQSTTLTTNYYSSTTSRRQNDVHPVLPQYYKVLPSTTKYYPVLPYYKVLLQYYSVLQTYYKVLLRTTEYYSSTTPYYKVVQKLQNEHFVRGFLNFSRNKLPKRAFRARLPQLFKRQASKTSISCEASATFQGTSFQNEHFVRGFLNFSRNKLPKRAFRARLPQLFKRQASKTSISCEASATFQGTSFQNEHFVRGFLNFSRNKLPKRAFRARLPQLFNQGASKVLRLPRKTRK